MSAATVRRIVEDYVRIAANDRGADSDGRTIKLTWHGGEPLLAGKSYFRQIVELERSLVGGRCRIVNAITTNGIDIDEEWIEIFKSGNFQVGISIDGPQDINDVHRVFPNGDGSYCRTIEGINKIKQSGLQFGVLMVVTREVAANADRVFSFLVSQELTNVNFIPFTALDIWLPPADYARFSIRMFDLWFELDNPNFYVRDFANILAGIFGREANLCEYKNCFGNYLGIDTSGDVYMCDLLIGVPEFHLGNVNTSRIHEILASPAYASLKAMARRNTPECAGCSVFLICTGGCMYRRFISSHQFPGRDIYCGVRKRLIAHIVNRLAEADSDAIRMDQQINIS